MNVQLKCLYEISDTDDGIESYIFNYYDRLHECRRKDLETLLWTYKVKTERNTKNRWLDKVRRTLEGVGLENAG